jgi:hypothetical protein
MSTAKSIPPRAPPPNSTNPADHDATSTKSSGRPTFDSRGNAVWEWKTETGQFSVDVSTQRLKKLEAPELSLDETVRIKKLDGLTLKEGSMPGGGFNPYERAAPANKNAGWPNTPAVAQKKPIPAQAPRKPVKDLKRLQEWMEMKKRLANQKDDD